MRRVMREILDGGEDGCDGEDQMKTWIFAATLLLVVFAKSAVFAAKLLTPKPQLEKEATHIVVGKVRSISSTQQVKGEWGFTNYVAEIAIDKVEKGEGLKAGDDVQVRYYSQGWRGSGSPPPFEFRAFTTAQAGRFRARLPRKPRLQWRRLYDRRPLRRVLQERIRKFFGREGVVLVSMS